MAVAWRRGMARTWRAGLGGALVLLVSCAAAHAAERLVVPPALRLLVIAPHPDDESLAAAGLMQEALAKGGRVHVLFVTNGDGYPEAVEIATGPRAPAAEDYRDFGELRRAEALVALARYRLMPSAATFLGFPDGGVADIWRRGRRAPAYVSPYTGASQPPYRHASDARARYTSPDLVGLLTRVVAAFDPDWIALPSPLDNHADHCATFAFVVAALRGLRTRAGAAARVPEQLLLYVVHASAGWPPPASVPGPLPEPPEKTYASAPWYSLSLTEAQVAAKREALQRHATQVAVMETLFRSFARPNEPFQVIDRTRIPSLRQDDPPCGLEPSPGADP